MSSKEYAFLNENGKIDAFDWRLTKPQKQRIKNQVIDQMNQDEENFVVLRPGEEWIPGMATEVKADDNECKIHEWHEVALFNTTVTECKKCGKLKESV